MLEKHVAKLLEFVHSSTLTVLLLCMFVDIATSIPSIFIDHLTVLKQVSEQHPSHMVQVIQIIGAVATIGEVSSTINAKPNMKFAVKKLLDY